MATATLRQECPVFPPTPVFHFEPFMRDTWGVLLEDVRWSSFTFGDTVGDIFLCETRTCSFFLFRWKKIGPDSSVLHERRYVAAFERYHNYPQNHTPNPALSASKVALLAISAYCTNISLDDASRITWNLALSGRRGGLPVTPKTEKSDDGYRHQRKSSCEMVAEESLPLAIDPVLFVAIPVIRSSNARLPSTLDIAGEKNQSLMLLRWRQDEIVFRKRVETITTHSRQASCYMVDTCLLGSTRG